jgi:hypothetical protein
MPAERPAEDDAAFQVLIDGDVVDGEPPRRSLVPLALLAFGLLVTALALHFGILFFFLPIIPFGLGGGTAVRRWFRRAWPRALRIHGGKLRLVTLGPFGPMSRGVIPIHGPVHVSLTVDGMAGHQAVRLVSGDEELWVTVHTVAHGLDVLRRLPPFFEEAGVPATFEGDAPSGVWH